MTSKICKQCNVEKDLSRFDKYRYNGNLLYRPICRECRKPISKRYYDSHRNEIIKHNSEYKKQNRSMVNDRNKKRKENDITFRLGESVRSVIKMSIRRNKGNKGRLSSLKYLSYSIQELQNHLEQQFEPWMNWNNWGKYDSKTWNDNDSTTWTWQIDHIIPKSDLLYVSMTDDNFKKCWALKNLRPLSAKQNIIDGPAGTRHLKKAV